MFVARLEKGVLETLARRYDSKASLAEALQLGGGALTVRVQEIRQVIEAFVRESVLSYGVPPRRTWIFGTEAVRQLRKASPAHYDSLTESFDLRIAFRVPPRKSPTTLDFVVLREKEEARYSLAAAIRSLPEQIKDGDSVIAIDQGAGSLELAVGRLNNNHIKPTSDRSYPLGTAILAAQLQRCEGDYKGLRKWVMGELGEIPLRGSKNAGHTVILGSAVTMLARIRLKQSGQGDPTVKYSPKAVHGRDFSIDDMDKLICDHTWKQELTPEEVSSGEFETVLAGLVGLQGLLAFHEKRQFVVCGEALRYGVAWELALAEARSE